MNNQSETDKSESKTDNSGFEYKPMDEKLSISIIVPLVVFLGIMSLLFCVFFFRFVSEVNIRIPFWRSESFQPMIVLLYFGVVVFAAIFIYYIYCRHIVNMQRIIRDDRKHMREASNIRLQHLCDLSKAMIGESKKKEQNPYRLEVEKTIIIKNIVFLTLIVLSYCSFASVKVSDVVAKQRYPWNGLVDISCNVSGIEGVLKGYEFELSAVMPNDCGVRLLSTFKVVYDGVMRPDKAVEVNGRYSLVWDAKADLGEVQFPNMVVRVQIERAKVQLWEGGPYWAMTNIGAEKPEDFGYYFWWGDTIGYKRGTDKWIASDGSNSNFSFSISNAPTYDKSISTLKSEGWLTSDGVLAPEHDAANIHWGNGWRMPTKDEFDALNNKCDWTRTTKNGVNGHIVKGRGSYASNSIFLPAAGCGNYSSLYNVGSYGYYWSSVPSSSYGSNAWLLYFHPSYHCTDSNYYRYYGRSVRPILGFTK